MYLLVTALSFFLLRLFDAKEVEVILAALPERQNSGQKSPKSARWICYCIVLSQPQSPLSLLWQSGRHLVHSLILPPGLNPSLFPYLIPPSLPLSLPSLPPCLSG